MARILILNDEANIAGLLTSIINQLPHDWEPLVAESHEQAREMIETHASKADAIDLLVTTFVVGGEQKTLRLVSQATSVDPWLMTVFIIERFPLFKEYEAFEHGAFAVIEKDVVGKLTREEVDIRLRGALCYRDHARRTLALRRYVDPRVFRAIHEDPDLLDLSSRTVTVAFWDLRGFSWLCEILRENPRLITGFLNDYFHLASECISECGGVIDKFMGDGVMALFGALSRNHGGNDDALNAVYAALGFRDRFMSILSPFEDKCKLLTAQEINLGLGCGIHTGDALVGNVGSTTREQFTAVGAPVNLASRIEGRAKMSQVLISQTTETRVKSQINCETAGKISNVKNIPGKFQLYSAIGCR